MDLGKPRGWSWLLMVIVAASGCYEWVRVPPSELPRLDESAPRPIIRPNEAPGAPVVRTEGGKAIEVAGDFAVQVTTEGESADFMSPLHCSLTGGTLRLAEDGDAAQSFRLEQIRSTQVYRRNESMTVIVEALGVVAGAAVFALFMNAVTHWGP